MRKIENRNLARLVAALAGLVGGVVWGLFLFHPALAGEFRGAPPPGFDRGALREELSRPLAELQKQGPEALRGHVQRLTESYTWLDLAADVPPAERRALADHILGRVAQASLLLREGQPGPSSAARGKNGSAWLASLGGVTGAFSENTILLVGVVGGLIVAFALGNLAGYRRGTSQASYYGLGGGDPRMWLVAQSLAGAEGGGDHGRVTLTEIREHLLAGQTVMFQLGYEIALEHRGRYQELIQGMRQALSRIDGHTYAVWEDPRHPNRFYEVLVCRRPSALERLTRAQGELAGLAAGIEACRIPGRPVLRRTWWGVLPEQNGRAFSGAPAPSTSRPPEV